jgi:hypothetical protein
MPRMAVAVRVIVCRPVCVPTRMIVHRDILLCSFTLESDDGVHYFCPISLA